MILRSTSSVEGRSSPALSDELVVLRRPTRASTAAAMWASWSSSLPAMESTGKLGRETVSCLRGSGVSSSENTEEDSVKGPADDPTAGE